MRRKRLKPIISYVIPCYNCETTIAETVHSIKDTHEAYRKAKELPSQWDQIELILINDGSDDATPYIIDTLAEEYHNIITVHQANKGKGYSRNLGNQYANAEIIGVLDSDDWHITDRTAYILKAFHENKSADVFYSGFLSKHLYEGRNMGKEGHFKAKPLDDDILRKTGDFCIGHSTVAYRREVILRHPYSEDRNRDDWWMLWNLYINGCEFIFNPKFMVVYRINGRTHKLETDEDKLESILKKKQKIMEPYFNKRNAA